MDENENIQVEESKLKEFKFGDIILSAPIKNNILSHLIKLRIHNWTHSRIMINNFEFIEVIPYYGVRISNLNNLIKFKNRYKWILLRLVRPLTEIEKGRMLHVLFKQIGKKYNYLAYLKLFYNINKKHQNKWFCFELIIKTYKNAGIYLYPNRKYFISLDFEKSNLLQSVDLLVAGRYFPFILQ
ncbi:MAG: YiiX/YebB-like N1pC/P60 family cysteine hydrolase [Nanoarchaeota archaeon]